MNEKYCFTVVDSVGTFMRVVGWSGNSSRSYTTEEAAEYPYLHPLSNHKKTTQKAWLFVKDRKHLVCWIKSVGTFTSEEKPLKGSSGSLSRRQAFHCIHWHVWIYLEHHEVHHLSDRSKHLS